jgi:hypothetical protein
MEHGAWSMEHGARKAQRHKGTKAQRHKGTKAQRHKGTKAQRKMVGMTYHVKLSRGRALPCHAGPDALRPYPISRDVSTGRPNTGTLCFPIRYHSHVHIKGDRVSGWAFRDGVPERGVGGTRGVLTPPFSLRHSRGVTDGGDSVSWNGILTSCENHYFMFIFGGIYCDLAAGTARL